MENETIRVILKKVYLSPEIKILKNTFKLKQAIVLKELEIIPYKNFFIICNSKEKQKYLLPNIALGLKNISGNFIVVNLDLKTKDFKAISQEDIIWILNDLEHNSFNNTISNKKYFSQKKSNYRERNFEYDNTIENNSFEERLINILTNIELTLASLLKK